MLRAAIRFRHESAAFDGHGESFTETKSAPAFPKDDGRALVNIWGLEAGGDKKDLWCGRGAGILVQEP